MDSFHFIFRWMNMKVEFVGGVYAHNGRLMLGLYRNETGNEFIVILRNSKTAKTTRIFQTSKYFFYINCIMVHTNNLKPYSFYSPLNWQWIKTNVEKKHWKFWFPFEKFIWLLLCPSYSTSRLSSSRVFQIQYLFRCLRNPSLARASARDGHDWWLNQVTS